MRSAAAPTRSASSRTGTRSSGWPAWCSPSKTDEWAEGRRYLGLDILAKSRLTLFTDTRHEVTDQPALELSA